MPLDNPRPSVQAEWSEAAERKLADLATFAHGLVHDLRNPLNVIRSNLYLLRQRLPADDPRATRSVDRIDDQVTVAMRMLEGVAAFYRADTPTVQRVQVNEVVRSVVATISAPDGAELQSDLQEGLPLVSVDPQLLDSAVRSLIRNALEALPHGGIARVTTAEAGGYVVIAVEDDGEGVPAEALPRVFEPLFSTRRARGGLGLALVAKIAAAHGAHASLESAPGAGTRAVLELPVGTGS